MTADIRDAGNDPEHAPAPAPGALGEALPPPDLDAVGSAVDTAPPKMGVTAVPFVAPRIDSASSDVAAAATTRVPGAVRDGYHRLPTAPVVTAASGPPEGEPVGWVPPAASLPPAGARVAPWVLCLSIVALAASIFVGFLLPLGLVAVIAAIVALRRPDESRGVAVWALVLGAVSVLYSAGWLLWGLSQLFAP